MWVEGNYKEVFDIKESIKDKIITQKEINEINMEIILSSIKDIQLKKDFEMVYNELFLKLNSWKKEINIEATFDLQILKNVVNKAWINIAEQDQNNKENSEKWNNITIDAYTPFEKKEGELWYRNNNKTTGIQFSKNFDTSKSKDFFN